MDSVMDIVNFLSIYHAKQKRQYPYYQIVRVLKTENVMDKGRS